MKMVPEVKTEGFGCEPYNIEEQGFQYLGLNKKTEDTICGKGLTGIESRDSSDLLINGMIKLNNI